MQSCICHLHMDEIKFFIKMTESCPFPKVNVTAAESCIVHKDTKTTSSPNQTRNCCSLTRGYDCSAGERKVS